MAVRQYSAETLRQRESVLRRFIGWCDERGINQPQDVTKAIMERYQRHLYHYRRENGAVLSSSSQQQYISNIRQFFRWLAQENHLLYNPASELFIPKIAPSLPVVLTEEEVERLLQQPDINTPYGVRDGKGGKDRLLPLGQRAVYWLNQYLQTIRQQFQTEAHEQTVFLNDYGEPFRDSKLGDKVKCLMNQAGITAPCNGNTYAGKRRGYPVYLSDVRA